jgi:hypothetical protein
MTERASIFEPEDEIDVSTFKPAAGSRRQDPAVLDAVRETAERKGFSSREAPAAKPTTSAAAIGPAPVAQEARLRRRRTGRDRQINIKTSDQAVEQLYALADANAWGLGETFEHALEALAAKQGAQ